MARGAALAERGRNGESHVGYLSSHAPGDQACLEVARSCAYLPEIDPQLEDKLRQVIGTLVRVVQRG